MPKKKVDISGNEIAIIIFFIALYLIYLQDLFIQWIKYLFDSFTALLPSIFSYILGFGWIISLFLAAGYFFNRDSKKKKKWLSYYKLFTEKMFFNITPWFFAYLIFAYLTSFLLSNLGWIATFIIITIFLLLIIILWRKRGK